MDTNELMKKILFEAKVERERIFLDAARLFLINAIIQCESEKGVLELDMDSTKMIGLVERMFSVELEYLDEEPENYLELYGD